MVALLVMVSSGPPSTSSASMMNSAWPDAGRSMLSFRSPLPAAGQVAPPVAVQVQVMFARPASSTVVTTAPSLSSGPALASVTRYWNVWPRPPNEVTASMVADRSASTSTPTPSKGTTSGLVGALLTRSTLALRAPSADGVNSTSNWHESPGATKLPAAQLLLSSAKSPGAAPPMPMLPISTSVVPFLVSVTVRAGLVWPTTTSPKSRAIGSSAITGMMPRPSSTKLSGLLSASLTTATLSDWIPIMPGANSYSRVQLAPAVNANGGIGQVPAPVSKNGGSIDEMDEIVASTLPGFSIVTASAGLVEPISWSPKSTVAGVIVISGASVIVMVVETDWPGSTTAVTSSATPVEVGVKVVPAIPAVSVAAVGLMSPRAPPSKSTARPSGTRQSPLKIELPPSDVEIKAASSAAVWLIGMVPGMASSVAISQLPASIEASETSSQPALPGPALQPHQLIVASDARLATVLLTMPVALPVRTLHLKSPAPLASILTPVSLLRTRLPITGTGGRALKSSPNSSSGSQRMPKRAPETLFSVQRVTWEWMRKPSCRLIEGSLAGSRFSNTLPRTCKSPLFAPAFSHMPMISAGSAEGAFSTWIVLFWITRPSNAFEPEFDCMPTFLENWAVSGSLTPSPGISMVLPAISWLSPRE